MRRATILALLLACLVGCDRHADRHTLARSPAIASEGPAFDAALLESTGAELTPGHRAQLLLNGHVFDGIVAEIGRARHSVNIVTYIWRKSGPSDRIVAALKARAPGVACRVLVDPVGSRKFEQQVKGDLEAAGCEVRVFSSPAGANTPELLSHNHRKLVLVDGRVAFTGGFGIWKSWEGDGESQEHWRDTHLRLEGPAVRDLERLFAENWLQVGGDFLPPGELAPVPPLPGGVRAAAVGSGGAAGLTNAERLTMFLIGSAQHRLWIANSYFLPSKPIQELLVAAKRRGVDVRILGPGPNHDLPPVLAAQRASYDPLLRAGIQVFEYQPAMMHAKTMVVDDDLVSVGSINLDPLSLKKLEEEAVLVRDRALTDQLARAFEQDLARSKPITLHSRENGGPLRRFTRELLWFGARLF